MIKANILEEVHRRYILYQVCKAIKYMHSGQLLHRDLKPSNVLLNSDCHVKLCDFGLARSVADQVDEKKEAPILTDYVATRWYRPPEILVGSSSYSKVNQSKTPSWGAREGNGTHHSSELAFNVCVFIECVACLIARLSICGPSVGSIIQQRCYIHSSVPSPRSVWHCVLLLACVHRSRWSLTWPIRSKRFCVAS